MELRGESVEIEVVPLAVGYILSAAVGYVFLRFPVGFIVYDRFHWFAYYWFAYYCFALSAPLWAILLLG
ncbi:MAG: hypothetical protein L0Z54_04575 [Thermoplasmata archaeon]|nr:hypothetical protein [Thermoplasmata archaeon]